MSTRLSLWCLAVITALCLPAPQSASGQQGFWPQWRGPTRDGLSTEKGILQDWNTAPPRLLWMIDGMGEGYAGVSVAQGRIYSTGNFSKSDDGSSGQGVVALRESDGQLLWRTLLTKEIPNHGYEGSRCTPTWDEDRLYVVTSDPNNGEIVCLSASDGIIQWRRSFKDWGGHMMSGWGFAESPLIDGDRVVCTPGGDKGMLVALDKHSGEEIWHTEIPEESTDTHDGRELDKGAGYSSIVISQGAGVKQYVQLVGAGLIGVQASDGRLLWSYTRIANHTANIPTPLVRGDYVFGATGYGTGSALLKLVPHDDGVKAEEVYFLGPGTLQNKHGGMVLVGDYIYCGHGDGQGIPICVELLTGKVAWGGKKRGPGRGEASVIYADGHIIYRYQDGVVALVEATPDAYRLLGQFQPAFKDKDSWSHPVVAGGRLYLREQDKLMCYALRPAARP